MGLFNLELSGGMEPRVAEPQAQIDPDMETNFSSNTGNIGEFADQIKQICGTRDLHVNDVSARLNTEHECSGATTADVSNVWHCYVCKKSVVCEDVKKTQEEKKLIVMDT